MQFISRFRKTGIKEVPNRRGRDINQVFCPEDLTKYHQKMDGVDWGEQLRGHCSGFSYNAHFKK